MPTSKDDKFQIAIDRYNTTTKHFPIQKNKKLKIGQVRSMTNKDDLHSPRKIVVVASIKEQLETRTCDVFLTGDITEFATERDYCHFPNEKTSSLNFTIYSDFIGNVDVWQLEDSFILGQICETCVSTLFAQSSQPDPDSYSLPTSHKCFERGSYEIRVLDNVWVARQRNYSSFLYDCNNFSDRDEFMTLRRNEFYDELIFEANTKNRQACYELASRIESKDQLDEFLDTSNYDYKKLLVLR